MDGDKGRALGHLLLSHATAAARLEAIEEVFQLATLVVELHFEAGCVGLRKVSARQTLPWRRGEQRHHVTSKGALWVDRALSALPATAIATSTTLAAEHKLERCSLLVVGSNELLSAGRATSAAVGELQGHSYCFAAGGGSGEGLLGKVLRALGCDRLLVVDHASPTAAPLHGVRGAPLQQNSLRVAKRPGDRLGVRGLLLKDAHVLLALLDHPHVGDFSPATGQKDGVEVGDARLSHGSLQSCHGPAARFVVIAVRDHNKVHVHVPVPLHALDVVHRREDGIPEPGAATAAFARLGGHGFPLDGVLRSARSDRVNAVVEGDECKVVRVLAAVVEDVLDAADGFAQARAFHRTGNVLDDVYQLLNWDLSLVHRRVLNGCRGLDLADI